MSGFAEPPVDTGDFAARQVEGNGDLPIAGSGCSRSRRGGDLARSLPAPVSTSLRIGYGEFELRGQDRFGQVDGVALGASGSRQAEAKGRDCQRTGFRDTCHISIIRPLSRLFKRAWAKLPEISGPSGTP